MWNRSGLERAHLSAAAVALLPAALLLTAAAPARDATLTVTAHNLRSGKGVVRACLTADPKDFPKCKSKAVRGVTVDAAGSVAFAFEGVAPGRYAIALLHDENANGKPDFALGMVPKEGFGFSRDAAIRMGPPSFDSAAFTVTAGQDQALRIKMRYLF